MRDRIQKDIHALHTRLRTSRQIDNQRLPAYHGYRTRQHRPLGNAHRLCTDRLRDSRNLPLCDRESCLRGDVPGRKTCSSRRQNQIGLTLVAQTDQLLLQPRTVIRQQQLFDHLISVLSQPLRNRRTAFVLPQSCGALIAQCDDRRLPWERRFSRLNFHRIPHGNHAAVNDLCKHTLARHDTVSCLMIDRTVRVALLADLCHLQQNFAAPQACSHRQTAKIDSADQQVFSECTRRDIAAAPAEVIDFFLLKQTDLPVPFSGMGIPGNSVICP